MFKQSIILSGIVNCLAVTSVLATEDENTLTKALTKIVRQHKPVTMQPFPGEEEESAPPLISLEQEMKMDRDLLNNMMEELSRNLATSPPPSNVPNSSSNLDGKTKHQDKK